MNLNILNISDLFNNLDYSKLSKDIIVSALYKIDYISSIKFTKDYLNVIKFGLKIAKKFKLSFLLFIDYTIFEDKKYMNELNKLNNIILIKYDSNNIRKYKAYQQFYGDLITFLPLFNYKNNNFNNVFVFNVEYYLYDKPLNLNFNIWSKSYKLFLKDNLDIFYLVYPYTSINFDFNDINPIYVNKDEFILASNNLICKYKFNYKIFDDILNNSYLEKKYKNCIKHKLITPELTNQTFLTFILYNYIKTLNYGYFNYFNVYYILNKIHYNLYNPEYSENKLNMYYNEVLKLYQYILNTNDININQLFKKINNNDKLVKRFYDYDKSKIFDDKTNIFIQNHKYFIKIYEYCNLNNCQFINI